MDLGWCRVKVYDWQKTGTGKGWVKTGTGTGAETGAWLDKDFGRCRVRAGVKQGLGLVQEY